MKRRDFLLEIGVEDLPARFVPAVMEEAEEYFRNALNARRIPFGEINVLGTHRRIVIVVKKIPENRPETLEVIQGPPEKVAFANGKPTKTLKGFLKAKGASIKDVEVRDTGKGKYTFVKVKTGGDSVIPHLGQIAEGLFSAVSLPKSMRWDESGMRFMRPIRYILCLYGERTVPFQVGSLKAGRFTEPNRLVRAKVKVESPSHFMKVMREYGIQLSPARRREKILRCVKRFEAGVGGKVPEEVMHSLLEEVVYMTEYPGCVLVDFDEKFTSLPPALITAPLHNQVKCFPFTGKGGKPLPFAVFVYDGKKRNKSAVKEGVRKVIKARLEDAEFYFMEDLRMSPDQFVEALKGINFGENLGTMWDRIGRIKAISEVIFRNGGGKLKRACELMDFDLTTSVVSEFPELHGYMGRIYAERAGEDSEVARAIEEHIYPRFSGDRIPESDIGTALSIADRIESICSHMVQGHKPAADADPFGVRRSAITLSEVLLSRYPDLDLEKLIEKALSYFQREDMKGEVLQFILQRFLSSGVQKNMSRDLLEASLIYPYNPLTIKMRYEALKSIEKSPLMEKLVLAAKRLNNILKGFTYTDIQISLFRESGENRLYEKMMEVKSELSELISSRDFKGALRRLGELSDVLDAFFQDVFVMVEDPLLRKNRLSLLSAVRELYTQVADFSRLKFEDRR